MTHHLPLLLLLLCILPSPTTPRKHSHTHHRSKKPSSPLPSTPSPQGTPSTTAALTLKVGNRTINTNLQSALDDISPSLMGARVPDSATYPPNVYNSLYNTGSSPLDTVANVNNNNNNNNSSASVIFEVLGLDPYSKDPSSRRKFSLRFILMTSLYGTLGLSCILATYCLLRMVGGRSKRNKQYMLLTKRDLDYPLGGGGI